MLGKYQGYLQTDGYEAYDRAGQSAENVVHVGCWAHVRRKFFEAQRSSQKAGSAEMALSMIGKLYRAETERGVHKDEQEFAAARRDLVEPILVNFRSWLERRVSQVSPGDTPGQGRG